MESAVLPRCVSFGLLFSFIAPIPAGALKIECSSYLKSSTYVTPWSSRPPIAIGITQELSAGKRFTDRQQPLR
eukprot:scaffold68515_cov32-Tisochrysis_lutea.AAC.1